MSDSSGELPKLSRPAVALAQEFTKLSPEDQALVVALIARLGGFNDEPEEFPPDVKFMDFDV